MSATEKKIKGKKLKDGSTRGEKRKFSGKIDSCKKIKRNKKEEKPGGDLKNKSLELNSSKNDGEYLHLLKPRS